MTKIAQSARQDPVADPIEAEFASHHFGAEVSPMWHFSTTTVETSTGRQPPGQVMPHDLWLHLRAVWQQLDKVVAFEDGGLSSEEIILLFQSLIDSGLAWSLTPDYALKAAQLIDEGACHEVTSKLRLDEIVR